MCLELPIPFGAYLLLERVGVGGTAEVLRAVRRDGGPDEPPVALKRLLPHIAEDPELCRLLDREVVALERMDHPCVPKLLDHGEVGGLPFLVMELLDGCSLRDLLGPRSIGLVDLGGLPVRVALWIAREISAGLSEADRCGVVHRDLSPTNVQITARGEVKILDFGIAKVAGLHQTVHGRGGKGKWAYSSPEQIKGASIDGRSDLFALGILLFELLTGRPPFGGASREEITRRVLEADFPGLGQGLFSTQRSESPLPSGWRQSLETLLAALLSRSPGGRPESAAEVASHLSELLGPSPMASSQGAEAGGDQRWLARAVAVIGPTLAHSRVVAAEHRGEVVTDPTGEGVTRLE